MSFTLVALLVIGQLFVRPGAVECMQWIAIFVFSVAATIAYGVAHVQAGSSRTMNSNAHTISLIISFSLEVVLAVRFVPQLGVNDRVLPASWHAVTLVLLGVTTLFLLTPLRRGSLSHRICGVALAIFPALLFGLYGYGTVMQWTHD
jgi:hypothetical protein